MYKIGSLKTIGCLVVILSVLFPFFADGARVKKTLRTEKNGFQWYSCEEKNQFYAMSLSGDALTERTNSPSKLGFFCLSTDDPGFFYVDNHFYSREGAFWGQGPHSGFLIEDDVSQFMGDGRYLLIFGSLYDDIYVFKEGSFTLIQGTPLLSYADEKWAWFLGKRINGCLVLKYQSIYGGGGSNSSSRSLTRRTFDGPIYTLFDGGKIIIPIEKGYTAIEFKNGLYYCDSFSGTDIYDRDGTLLLSRYQKTVSTPLGDFYLTTEGSENKLFDDNYRLLASGHIADVAVWDGKLLMDGGSVYGKFLVDLSGRVIIPQSGGVIGIQRIGNVYYSYSNSQHRAYTLDGVELAYSTFSPEMGNGYLVFRTPYSIVSTDGTVILDCERDFKGIKAIETDTGTYFLCMNKEYFQGVIDMTGNTVLPFEFKPLEHIGANLFSFKSNGFYGVVSLNGKVIIPTSRGYSSIGNYSSIQGTIPFTMEGFKGECDKNGKVISKIKVSSPASTTAQSASSSSSKGSSQNSSRSSTQSGSTSTVVVEHQHHGVIQEWVPCSVCNGTTICNVCAGTGTTYMGSAVCVSCNGSKKCTYCSGQGGRYVSRQY